LPYICAVKPSVRRIATSRWGEDEVRDYPSDVGLMLALLGRWRYRAV